MSDSTRRHFLKTTAAAAGIATAGNLPAIEPPLVPSIPAGRPADPPGPDEPIRMGLIGPGGMGTAHCHAIMGLNKNGREKVQIVALADVCKPRLDNAHKACSDGQPGVEVAAYRNYKDLLARQDIHGVLIASPEHWHAQHAVDAIQAGKDVYCEKPMTLRLRQAVSLRKIVKDSDRVFTVGTQHITQKKYHAARDLIRAGAIGKPVSSQTSYCRNSKDGEWNYYGIDPSVVPGPNLDWDAWCGPAGKAPFDTLVYHRWRRYRHWSTGIIGDLLVHQMTPMFFTMELGWPTRVVAQGEHMVDMAMENHDQVHMALEFEDKHHMHILGSTCNEYGLEKMIRGYKGNIFLNSGNCVLRPERIWSDEIDEQVIQCEAVADHDEMRLNWLNCIRTREEPLGNIELATKVIVAVDLATRSMWDGRAYWFDKDRMWARPA